MVYGSVILRVRLTFKALRNTADFALEEHFSVCSMVLRARLTFKALRHTADFALL